MARPTFSVSARVPAPPARVYGLIADYRESHPRILPRPPFLDLWVEAGGVGAGTLVGFRMRLLGRTLACRGRITEPEPGRILEETELNSGLVTRFIVDAEDEGRSARVTIATAMPRSGLLGRCQLRIMGWLLRPVYAEELAKLAALATAG